MESVVQSPYPVLVDIATDGNVVVSRADGGMGSAARSQRHGSYGQQNQKQRFHKHLLFVSHAAVMLRVYLPLRD